MTYVGEGKNPDDVVKTRRIQITAENVHEVANDIRMDPAELEEMYMNHKSANAPMFIVVRED